MKKNAQQALLCLYSFDRGTSLALPVSAIRIALANMSDGGFRSLLLYLERKHWLSKESVGSAQFLSLTNKGREALRAKFPALNEKWVTWQGEWDALVFLKAPDSDQQFRYLRQQLLANQVLPLSRGIYLSAGGFSPEITELCRSLYQNSVVIFSVGDWQFGLDRPIITNYYALGDVAGLYSGISKDVDQLLVKINSKKSSTNQQKMNISTVIDRLCSCLKSDPGFTQFYFPGVLDSRDLLPKIQQLLQL